MRMLIAAAALLALAGPAKAYDLFHPVPAAELRELATDRPDKTESPQSVDAGHFQIEMNLGLGAREQSQGLRSDDLSLVDFNAKLGLTDCLDIQFVHEPSLRSSVEDLATGDKLETQGRGDLTIRTKFALGTPQGFTPSLALMPFIKIPMANPDLGNEKFESGLIVPFGWDLPLGFALGCMAEGDLNANSADEGRHLDGIFSASLSHELFGSLGMYWEYWTQRSGEDGVPSQQTADTGLTLGLGPNAQLDLGANIGLDEASTDLELFLGASFRL